MKKTPSNFFIIGAIFYIFLIAAGFLWLKWQFWENKPAKTKQQSTAEAITLPKQADPLITKVPNFAETIKKPFLQASDPRWGGTNTPITIVIYADYECQYCGQLVKIAKKMVAKFKGQASLVFKDFPDSAPSSPSYQAAIAARCAQRQNKFWPFNQALFAVDSLATSTFEQIAQKLNLNLGAFKACFRQQQTKDLIEDNIFEANALKISVVPDIFINGKEFMGQMTEKEMANTIKTMLKQ